MTHGPGKPRKPGLGCETSICIYIQVLVLCTANKSGLELSLSCCLSSTPGGRILATAPSGQPLRCRVDVGVRQQRRKAQPRHPRENREILESVVDTRAVAVEAHDRVA